jgi:hypothetical protein
MRVTPLAISLSFFARAVFAAICSAIVAIGVAGESVTRVDPSFRNDAAVGQAVLGIARRHDDRIWAGGMFSRLGGGPVTNLALLEGDGSLRPGFVSAIDPGFQINHLVTEPDGGCLVAGEPVASGTTVFSGRSFFRVDPAGKVDEQFPGWNQSSNTAVHLSRIAGDQVLLTTAARAAYSPEPIASRELIMKFSAKGIRDEDFAKELEDQPSPNPRKTTPDCMLRLRPWPRSNSPVEICWWEDGFNLSVESTRSDWSE